jgi:hypothetical protein
VQRDPRPVSGVGEAVGRLDALRDRLLHQHVHAPLGARDPDRRVQGARRGDDDGVGMLQKVAVVPKDNDSERDGLGPQITKQSADVSEWVKYGPDRTAVDLRNLIRSLPAMPHPMLVRTDDWVELMTNDGSDADAIVVFGKRP